MYYIQTRYGTQWQRLTFDVFNIDDAIQEYVDLCNCSLTAVNIQIFLLEYFIEWRVIRCTEFYPTVSQSQVKESLIALSERKSKCNWVEEGF